MRLRLRGVVASDLPEIVRIQRACYGDHFIESRASFAAKLSAHGGFSFLAIRGDEALGYVIALPWVFGSVPALDGLVDAVPPDADGVYIHDLAVDPGARNAGLAERLLASVLDAAGQGGYRQAFLVAVQGAASYWPRHGFEVVHGDDNLRRALAKYGEDAAYMVRRLGPSPVTISP